MILQHYASMVYTVIGYCDKKSSAEIKVYSTDAKCGSMTAANQVKKSSIKTNQHSSLIMLQQPHRVGVLQVY